MAVVLVGAGPPRDAGGLRRAAAHGRGRVRGAAVSHAPAAGAAVATVAVTATLDSATAPGTAMVATARIALGAAVEVRAVSSAGVDAVVLAMILVTMGRAPVVDALGARPEAYAGCRGHDLLL